MFIIIPLIFILGSVIGILIIIGRKASFLKKLSPEAHETKGNLFVAFFPELVEESKKIKFKEYSHAILVELEKFLRRLRLLSLKIDHASESLIKRIRKIHLTVRHESMILPKQEVSAEIPNLVHEIKPAPPASQEIINDVKDILRKEEQDLIIQIAKSPKDAVLYEKLGDIYVRIGNFEDALESYSTALSLNPSSHLLKKKEASVRASQPTKSVVQ